MHRLAAVFALSLVACGAARPSAPTVPGVVLAPAKPIATATDTIVLGPIESIDLAMDGTPLGTNEAARVAAGTKILTMKQAAAKGAYSCDLDFTPHYHYDGTYEVRGLSLLDPAGDETVVVPLIPKETAANAIAMQLQETSITGVVGSYVFVNEASVFYGCGAAHPIGSKTGFVWDAKNGTKIVLTPPDNAQTIADAALQGQGMPEEGAAAVEAIPVFDAQGRLSIRWRYEKGATYAETDGQGSDYTISTFYDATELPDELASLREPPAALSAYLATNPMPIRGWSRVD